jgi:DNA-binding CsgD family transcriptional regulator
MYIGCFTIEQINGIPNIKIQSIYMPDLTKRELKMLKMICNDKSNLEIAAGLELSLRQTEKVKALLYKKTKTRSGIGLLKWAVINKYYSIKRA